LKGKGIRGEKWKRKEILDARRNIEKSREKGKETKNEENG
jgi:hypothetical protein